MASRWWAENGWTDKPLNQGEVIDRYGPDTGRYSSPMTPGDDGILTGESYESRALPYDQSLTEYHQYSVEKQFANQQSTATPSFDQAGKAVQNRHAPIADLIDGGYLKEITK